MRERASNNDVSDYPKLAKLEFKGARLGQALCYSSALIKSAEGKELQAYFLTTVGIITFGAIRYLKLRHDRRFNP